MASDGGFSIFGAKHYLEAVRSMGFRTTAEALFELVDNSIEAGALTRAPLYFAGAECGRVCGGSLESPLGYRRVVGASVAFDGRGGIGGILGVETAVG